MTSDTRVSKILIALSVLTVWGLVLPAIAPLTRGQVSTTSKVKTFATAPEAANALIDAAEQFDETALAEILGADGYDIVHTGEPARDREVAKEFAALARMKTKVSMPSKNPHRAFLLIGADEWPFPVPIVKAGSA